MVSVSQYVPLFSNDFLKPHWQSTRDWWHSAYLSPKAATTEHKLVVSEPLRWNHANSTHLSVDMEKSGQQEGFVATRGPTLNPPLSYRPIYDKVVDKTLKTTVAYSLNRSPWVLVVHWSQTSGFYLKTGCSTSALQQTDGTGRQHVSQTAHKRLESRLTSWPNFWNPACNWDQAFYPRPNFY